ncbi:tRNA uracil 4-sulfurtransferase ThiI [Curtanaerobium respiraculi]|uniref:tRNA uracil 4-sulfurtransferase ThiI n=1 Tax=Curtanaerobium respiraculi TaxID=2949669 RepID=UPI0024B3757D|nr:tRNA uracil 4-sulfurtransferase ThiI [Curtanaerobium respiraculi]
MEFQRICLVHYHEIGLKGHNRSSFENRLLKNIRALLEGKPIRDIRRISGRVLILVEQGATWEDACDIEESVLGVPGVARVSCGYACERDLEAIGRAAVAALDDAGDFTTFKVAARRNHTDFPIDSMTLNREVGALLCAAFPDKIVKMKDPDALVHVEVIQGGAYVYARSERGVGGLPVGSSGKVVSMLSSGIDSPVASWRMARRGAIVIGVHFSGRPQTSSTSEFLVDDIAHLLERTGCIARVYMVPFGNYQREIAVSCPPELRIILYRRLMFRVAERIAQREGAKALVSGESLGQVASQTIENILVTNAVVGLPVFRPLIGSDKQEIISDAEQLGTFEISSQDAPDCCTLFMPRNPETHAKPEKVEAAEAGLPIEAWVDEIVEAAEVHDYVCPSYRKRA